MSQLGGHGANKICNKSVVSRAHFTDWDDKHTLVEQTPAYGLPICVSTSKKCVGSATNQVL